MTNPSIACDASDSGHENVAEKGLLRIALLAARKAISADQRLTFDTAIGERVINWATALPDGNSEDVPGRFPVSGVLGVYWPIRDEPDLRPAYATLIARGVQLALPVVVGKDAPLQFIRWQPGEAMIKDSFGVAIPANGEIVIPQALLIPCVGFNPQRLRLGYGGGFYDRTLAIEPRPIALGIAYAAGLVDFSGGHHDIALDQIFTERDCF